MVHGTRAQSAAAVLQLGRSSRLRRQDRTGGQQSFSGGLQQYLPRRSENRAGGAPRACRRAFQQVGSPETPESPDRSRIAYFERVLPRESSLPLPDFPQRGLRDRGRLVRTRSRRNDDSAGSQVGERKTNHRHSPGSRRSRAFRESSDGKIRSGFHPAQQRLLERLSETFRRHSPAHRPELPARMALRAKNPSISSITTSSPRSSRRFSKSIPGS